MSSPASRWLGRRDLLAVSGVRIPSYLAMLYLGCVAGVIAGAAAAASTGLSVTRFALAAIVLLVPALVGSRMSFVLRNRELFRDDPRRLWRRGDGGSALYGGLVLSIAMSVPVLALAGLPFWAFWDAASITMIVGLIFTRAGCLMHGCCAGRETAGPVGMWLPNHRGQWRRRVPTPLLEAACGVVLFAGVLVARDYLPVAGTRFLGVVAAYAAIRLALDPSRESESPARATGRVALASWTALLIAAAGALFQRWP